MVYTLPNASVGMADCLFIVIWILTILTILTHMIILMPLVPFVLEV